MEYIDKLKGGVKMMKKARKLMVAIVTEVSVSLKMMVALLTIMMVMVMMTPVTVKATCENERFALNVNKYGMATVTDKTEDMTYQLTKAMTTEEGGIDDASDTVYLRFKDGSLYVYSPKYQKDKKLHFLEENVVKLIFDNDKRLQGYQTADGSSKALLEEESVKNLVKDENTGDKKNTNNSSNGNASDKTAKSDVFVSNEGNDNKTTVDNTAVGSGSEKNNNVNVLNQGNNNTTSVQNKTTNTKEPNVNVINNGNGNTTTVVNNVTTNNIIKKTTKVIRNYRMKGKALYNSKGKKVDIFKLKKGKLTYHTVKTKDVKYAKFNEVGNLLYITKKGKGVVIDRITLRQKTIAKCGITKFGTTKRALAKYAYRKNGTRIDVRKK